MEYNEINRSHLIPIKNSLKQKEIFKNSVGMIEIEVFSYCNRKCWFCPNSEIDRITTNTYMPEENYLKILDELAEINYDRLISYSRYNEPLSDKIILTRLKQAKEKLPNAFLHTNTNGDYITKEYINELYEAGLRSLNIQSYLLKNELFDEKNEKNKLNILREKLGLEVVNYHEIKDEWYQFKLKYHDMRILIYSRNFTKNGCDRGGLLEINKFSRTEPCILPFDSLFIDYNGETMPCCNLRSDSAKHRKYSLGNIQVNTLFQLYSNAYIWRRVLATYSKKNPPCNTCSFRIIEKTKETSLISTKITNLINNKKMIFFKNIKQKLIDNFKKIQ